MLQQVLHTIRSYTTITGVECITADDGAMSYHYVILKKRRSKVSMISHSVNALSFEELRKQLTNAHPVVVVLSGKGILLKEFNDSISGNDHLAKALPGADARDLASTFYSGNGQNWISVSKRSVSEKLVELFSSAGFRVISVIPGIAGLIGIIRTILPEQEQILSGNYQMEVLKNSVAISKTEATDDYSIDQQKISSRHLPSFSAAICMWLFPPVISWLPERVSHCAHEETSRNQFLWMMRGLPFFFLAILVINFFIFSSLNKKEKDLASQLSMYQAEIDQVAALQLKVNDRKNLATALGIERESLISAIADRIGESLPNEITLSQMSFNPLMSKIKENEPMQFENSTLNIVGETNNGSVMNQWLKDLSAADWTGDVELLRFDTDKGKGIFEIAIRI